MNLTLSGTHPRTKGIIRYPTPKQTNQPNCLPTRQSAPVQATCGHYFFKNCVDQQEMISSDQNQLYQHSKLMQHSRSEAVLGPVPLESRLEVHQKRKISLSLCHSENNFKTPKKMSVQINNNLNDQSNKRAKTYSGHQQNLVRSNSNENKTHLVNIHQMKSSLKPTTIPSQANSAKKSNLSGSKKMKLSLSGNFKSQIQPIPSQKRQDFEQFIKKVDFDKLIVEKQSEPQESGEDRDNSFMTTKLANIYGEKSEEPSSNIVYYNRLMGNQQWKVQAPAQAPEPSQQINNVLSPSISWNISQQNPYQSQPSSIRESSEHSQEFAIPREPIRERRWIGDYAPTLKTFNNSQSKQDQQSVVIGHGPRPNQFPPISFQRGSVKDYYKEPYSQQIKRACTSFGAEEGCHTEQDGSDRLQEWLSHPIQEDCSQIQN